MSDISSKYYEKVKNRPMLPGLPEAIELARTLKTKVAVDCGCGAGQDIRHFLDAGFTVHGFDVEPKSVTFCREQYSEDSRVAIAEASFGTYDFPKQVALIAASASLYFCPKDEFDSAWRNIVDCLIPGGIVFAMFIGDKDTWSQPEWKPPEKGFGQVLPFTKSQVRSLVEDSMEVVSFTERDADGVTALGDKKHWHTFTIIGRKPF